MRLFTEMKKEAVLFLFVLNYFCSNAQVISDSLSIDNRYRTFHFKKHSSTNTGASLVFALHGSGGSGMGIMNSAKKLEAIAEKENFIIVYPDGYNKYWNECRKHASSSANIENIDENTFFNGMIEYFTTRYRINPGHVFVIGTSGGGHMAYKLALTSTQKFKAIAAIIANLPDTSNLDCSESKLPISVMIINGTSDSTNPYNGGEVKTQQATFGRVRSTDATFRYWAEVNGYKGNPKKTTLPDTDPADGKRIEEFTYRKRGKPEVVLLKVINGKHNYPNDIDVYLEAWDFFKRQIR